MESIVANVTKMTYLVVEIEHDSWSGSSVIDRKVFETKAEADAYAKKINDKNTGTVVPDYYTRAEVRTQYA